VLESCILFSGSVLCIIEKTRKTRFLSECTDKQLNYTKNTEIFNFVSMLS